MKEKRNINSSINRVYISRIDKVEGTIKAPPSKSVAIRKILIASLIEEESIIKNFGESEDVVAAINIIKKWAKVEKRNRILIIKGSKVIKEDETYFVHNSATLFRMLLALFSLLKGKRIIYGGENLNKRDFSISFREAIKLGAKIKFLKEEEHPPILVEGCDFKDKELEICDPSSSQFVSGILVALSFINQNFLVKIVDSPSFPYIKLTEEILKEFGKKIENKDTNLKIYEGKLNGIESSIEGDFSNSAFFGVLAYLTNGRIKITNLNPCSFQGDKIFFEIIKSPYSEVKYFKNGIEVSGTPFNGFNLDLKDVPDLFLPLALLSLKCSTPSILKNIKRLENKESHRVTEFKNFLKKIGGFYLEEDDKITIFPQKCFPSVHLNPKDDHRLFMTYSIYGAISDGVYIENPSCLNKSYPSFLDDLKKLLKDNIEYLRE